MNKVILTLISVAILSAFIGSAIADLNDEDEKGFYELGYHTAIKGIFNRRNFNVHDDPDRVADEANESAGKLIKAFEKNSMTLKDSWKQKYIEGYKDGLRVDDEKYKDWRIKRKDIWLEEFMKKHGDFTK